MKQRVWLYPILLILSYFIGVLLFRGAHFVLNIDERSEYHLLYPGIIAFYIFLITPLYIIITYVFRSVLKKHSILLLTIILIIIGFLPSLLVPFFGGMGFGYLNVNYFGSEMAILLYSFYTGSAIAFSLGSTIIERMLQQKL
ncbi:hypothetical protein [Paenibacillus lautus]|uniref:hypothetical protein n=1 Tax=Paenibacillus lautus TaxID=1401 RepID=UPI003D2C5F99